MCGRSLPERRPSLLPQSISIMPVIQSSPDKAFTPVILGLFTGVTALIASEFIPVSLLTPISEGLGITPGTAGQTVTAVGAAAFLTSLLIAPMLPGTDRGRLLLLFTFLTALSNALIAWTDSVAVHFLARALLGFCVGGFWSLSVSVVQRLVHLKALPKAFSIVYSGVSVATLVALPGASAMSEAFGWRSVFWAAALLSAVTFVWQFLTMPAVKPNQSAGFSAMKEPLRDRRVVFGLFATFASYAGYHTVFTYVRPVLEESAGLSPSGVSIALLVYALVNVAGTLIAGKLYEKNFAPAFMATALLALAAPILMWALSGHIAVIGALILSALVFGFIPVGWSVWMVRTVPGHTEVVGGLYVAVVQGSVGFAANMGGMLYDVSGVMPLFLMSAALALFGLLLIPGALFGRITGFSSARAASRSVEGAR